jgi:hypothetical protein
MAERLTLLGRADPLGHFFPLEEHNDNPADRCAADESAREDHDTDPGLRSAKSIVLASRIHVFIKL